MMSKPIRVLHVLGGLNRAGAETLIMNIYRNIDREKVQFDFIVHTDDKCDYDEEINALGGKVYRVPQYSGKNHFKYKRAWQFFFREHSEYQIVHGHMRSTASIYLKIAKNFGMRTIAHSHSTASRGNKIEQFVKNFMQLPIRYIADYLFACSDEAGRWLFGKNVVKKENYKVIKNSIDVEKYTFNNNIRKKIRQSLNIGEELVIGHVGSFTHPKNHKLLIATFNEVQKQVKDAILLLIGEGVLKTEIQNQISHLELKNKVIITGSVPNVNDYLQVMDIFVFPSLFEGLGMAVIEAQASGLQCVIADTLPKEAIVTKNVEILSLNDRPQLWANSILKYSHGYERLNNYEKIKSCGYDIKNTAKWVENFYLKVRNE
jgi:glycosyltransferase involved in cell wall biosynthesis